MDHQAESRRAWEANAYRTYHQKRPIPAAQGVFRPRVGPGTRYISVLATIELTQTGQLTLLLGAGQTSFGPSRLAAVTEAGS